MTNTVLDIQAGTDGFAPTALDLLDANFPVFTFPQRVWGASRSGNGSFAFDPQSGPILVDFGADVHAEVNTPGNGSCFGVPDIGKKDTGWAIYFGSVTLGVNAVAPPLTGVAGGVVPGPPAGTSSPSPLMRATAREDHAFGERSTTSVPLSPEK